MQFAYKIVNTLRKILIHYVRISLTKALGDNKKKKKSDLTF